MRILSFFFAFCVVVCYSAPFGSGLGGSGGIVGQCHSTDQSAHHSDMQSDDANTMPVSNGDNDGDRVECCHPSLLNAPIKDNALDNNGGGSFTFIPTFYENSSFDVETFKYVDKGFYLKQRYGPPDIFLTKSAFLL